MKSLIALVLAICLIPGIAIAVAVLPYVNEMGVQDPLQIAQIATGCIQGDLSGNTTEVCNALQHFNWLGLGGMVFAGLGFFLVVTATLIAIVTGWNRMLLALSFPLVSFFAILIIGVLTLGQAALAAGSIYLAEVYFLEAVHPWVIGAVALFGGLVALAVLKNVFTMFRTATTSVVGLAIQPVQAPHIHRLVLNVARKLKIKPPRNIVVGFDPSFFATTARVSTPFDKRPLTGESLYLSLPLLRVLSEQETLSIIGHELGHFSGGDTAYSRRFAPAYRGLSQVQQNLRGDDGKADLWALPALVTVNFVLNIFGRAEKRIGRAREMRADQIGADIGSPEALSSALVKLGILGNIWQLEFDDMAQRVRHGRFSRNLSRNFVERARHDIDHDKVAALAALSLDAELAHPTDTHPTTRERIEAFGLDPDQLVDYETFKANLFPDDTVISKSDSIDGIEEQITDAYQQLMLHFHGMDESEEARSVSAFSNLLSLWLAKMASVDGHVDDSEIAVAQEEASKYDPAFDATSFKENCRHPEDIPPTEKLVYWANTMLTEGGAARLKDVLRKIAEADGHLHEAEAALLAKLDEELIGGLDPD